jgi:hypothetical protein
MKKKKSPPKQATTHAELADRLGCSRSLVTKLYGRGYSTSEIITRVNAQRAKAEARALQVNRPSTERVNGRVNGHTNGHDPDEFPTIPVPSFAESEKRKEYYLSEIRRAEAARLHAQLFPIQPLLSIVFAGAHHLKRRIQDLPGELSDELGPALTEMLRLKISAIFAEAQRITNWECLHHGAEPPPPAPPEPIRARLSYYERYLKNSRTGEIEIVPPGERMEDKRWMHEHPSVTEEQWFALKQKKAAWDAEMGALLARRSEWDLPSELPDEPPPEPPLKDAA